jgi:cyclophilin family peptidyl-prolyl cis-trans isomerase
MRPIAFALVLSCFALTVVHGQRGRPTARPPAPVMVIETARGTIEITLMPSEAPKSVAHIIGLVNSHFYRGQRFHRVEASLVQFGDPSSRDMTRADSWGTGSSGDPIGVSENTRSMKHVRGAVGLAHTGDPKYADSQLYIMKTASPGLDGKHAIIGHVTKGMEVVDKLQVADVLKTVTIR